MISKRFGYQGSLVCGASIFLFSYVFKIIPEFAKGDFIAIINNGPAWKILTLSGGCLIIANTFRNKDIFFQAGLTAITCFFMWAGIAHFLYSSFVDTLIPDYIPFHRFWTYFCGVCLILASIGLWIPGLRSLVAMLSSIMIFLWFLMLHIPRYLMHSNGENRIDGCVRIADHRCTDVDCIHSFFIKKINGYKTPVHFRNALVPYIGRPLSVRQPRSKPHQLFFLNTMMSACFFMMAA